VVKRECQDVLQRCTAEVNQHAPKQAQSDARLQGAEAAEEALEIRPAKQVFETSRVVAQISEEARGALTQKDRSIQDVQLALSLCSVGVCIFNELHEQVRALQANIAEKDARLTTLTHDLSTTRAQLNTSTYFIKQLRAETRRTHAAHTEQLATLQTLHASEMKQLTDAHTSELQQAKDKYDDAYILLTQQFNTAIAEARNVFTAALAAESAFVRSGSDQLYKNLFKRYEVTKRHLEGTTPTTISCTQTDTPDLQNICMQCTSPHTTIDTQTYASHCCSTSVQTDASVASRGTQTENDEYRECQTWHSHDYWQHDVTIVATMPGVTGKADEGRNQEQHGDSQVPALCPRKVNSREAKVVVQGKTMTYSGSPPCDAKGKDQSKSRICKPLCAFFQVGQCNKSKDDCPYEHALATTDAHKQFLEQCRDKFGHSRRDGGNRNLDKGRPCPQMQYLGICSFGNQCKFSHAPFEKRNGATGPGRGPASTANE
jgi:hypothetical protein